MSIINITQLNYSIGVEDILKDISCNVNERDRIGIVGVNGAGKSTLLRLIMSENEVGLDDKEYIEKSSGTIAIAKDKSIAYLKQREHFKEGISVWDSLDTKIDPREFEEKNGYSLEKGKRGILSSLGFSEDMYNLESAKLSGGEQTRLALGAVLLKEPDVLLLDEPTNHLDIPTLSWLEGKLKSYKGTLLIISHDRYFLDNIVNRIFEIENKRLTAFNGNYTEYKEKKKIIYEENLKHYELQREEIKRQEELITRWHERGTEHLIKRAQSREKRLAQIERLEKPLDFKDEIKLSFKQNLKTGNDIIISDGLGYYYNDNEYLFKDFECIIKSGERICIIGPNGCGKSTLLKMFMGELRPKEGRIKLGTNVILGYYDQHQEGLRNENTVLNEMYNSKGVLIGPNEYKSIESTFTETDLRRLLGCMRLTGDDVFKKIESLSGGEKARVSLLKLMMTGANVLVLDEPTNHLDIASKEIFEDALLAFPGTEIIVTHDRYFLEKVATRIIDLSSYCPSYKKEVIKQKENKEIGELGFVKGSEEERLAKKKLASEAKRKEKLVDKLENEIKELESKKEELEKLLCMEEIFNDPKRAGEISKELNEVKEKLENVYLEWMENS